MPDSPRTLSAAHTASIDRDDHDATVLVEVSTDKCDSAPACLAAPPRDVGRMLERYATMLPRYLDAHRLREIQASRRRWPVLRPTHQPGEDTGS